MANEYILCSPKVCPKARAVQPREYDIPAEDLIARMDKVVLTQPRITVIDKFTKDTPLKKEYVQRSLIFQWPDVITIEAIPLEEKKSTLAIHSYSIYGAGDLGVNGNRVRSWVGLLEDDINDVVRK